MKLMDLFPKMRTPIALAEYRTAQHFEHKRNVGKIPFIKNMNNTSLSAPSTFQKGGYPSPTVPNVHTNPIDLQCNLLFQDRLADSPYFDVKLFRNSLWRHVAPAGPNNVLDVESSRARRPRSNLFPTSMGWRSFARSNRNVNFAP